MYCSSTALHSSPLTPPLPLCLSALWRCADSQTTEEPGDASFSAQQSCLHCRALKLEHQELPDGDLLEFFFLTSCTHASQWGQLVGVFFHTFPSIGNQKTKKPQKSSACFLIPEGAKSLLPCKKEYLPNDDRCPKYKDGIGRLTKVLYNVFFIGYLHHVYSLSHSYLNDCPHIRVRMKQNINCITTVSAQRLCIKSLNGSIVQPWSANHN